MAAHVVLFPGQNQALQRVAQQLQGHPSVTLVASANAALWQVRRLRPDIIVADAQPPDMKAIELMEIATLMVPNARVIFCGPESQELLQFIEGTRAQLIRLGTAVDQQVWQVYTAMGTRPPVAAGQRDARAAAPVGPAIPPVVAAGREPVTEMGRGQPLVQRRDGGAAPVQRGRQAPPSAPEAPATQGWIPRGAATVVDAEQMATVQKLLEGLAAEVAAQSVLLLDTSGMRLAEVGVAPPVLAHLIGPLLATSFSTEAELARLLHDQEPSALHLYEGARYEVFSFNVGYGYILTIIFDKQVAGVKVGSVWVFAKRASRQLQAILEK